MPSSLSLRIRINKILSVGVPINDVCPLASLAALQKTCKAGDLFKATCLKGSFALASLAALQKMADVGKQARFDVASNDPENIPRLQVLWCLSVLLASCSGVSACSLLLSPLSSLHAHESGGDLCYKCQEIARKEAELHLVRAGVAWTDGKQVSQ